MRLLVSRTWQATVKRFELRPGSVTEWMLGQIMEGLTKMVENSRQTVYKQETTVKKVEERMRTEWVEGLGKEAKTKETSDGWWITFTDNLTAVRCESKPDCEPGDRAVCTWEFHKAK
jgi:hypothetical protein